jgi:hypothetical protein
LAVSQFCDNGYEKLFYDFDRRMKTSNWKKDLWVRELKERSNDVKAFLDGRKTDTKEVESDLALITRELEKEMLNLRGFNFPNIGKLQPGKVDKDVITEVETALEMLSQHYRNTYKQAEREKEARIAAMTATPELRKDYFALLDDQRNESLSDFVTNKNDVNVITLSNGELVQKSDPVYVRPVDGGFFSAQFYAPAKRFFGLLIPTLWANVMLLWGMTLALAFALKLDLMPKSIALMERAFSKRPT